ncbi:hypothetical protein D3C86_1522400 [compost metagenome]
MCFNEYLSVGPSFGLPKCDIKITDPPSFKIFLIVGVAPWILLSSVILKLSSKGTLKSTRISAFLSAKLKLSTVFISIVFVKYYSSIQMDS